MNKVTSLILSAVLYTIILNTIYAQDIQRVRIDFETPDGCSRQLLLGFTPNNAATDGFDYGYDGLAPDMLPNDLNWLIEENRYVIQGVGAFENTKRYPLGLYVTIPGTIKIELHSLENFTENINVFVYDSLEETYTKINNAFYENTTDAGAFQNRYFIAFKEPSLSSDDFSNTENDIKYLRNSGELLLDNNSIEHITELSIFNVQGQRLLHKTQLQTKRFKLDFKTNSNTIYIVKLKTPNGVISKKIII